MLAVALMAVVLVAMGAGAVPIAPLEVVAIVAAQAGLELPWAFDERQATVLTAIRIPRVLTAALVGAAWATAGVAMQGLYRTPLADPALVGIGGGAALGAALGTAIAIGLGVLVEPGGTALVVATASAAAAGSAAVVYRVATTDGGVVVARMLLAGIAISALFGALTALVVVGGRDADLGSVASWSLGSLGGAVGRDVLAGALVGLPLIALLVRLGPRLDALALGEREARHLGVDVRRLTMMTSLVFAAATGLAVATAGIVGFVGLMVPSLVRGWLGTAHRIVAIGSAMLGALILVAADVVARSLFSPAELPVGVITTVVGAPFFLWLLRHERGLLAR